MRQQVLLFCTVSSLYLGWVGNARCADGPGGFIYLDKAPLGVGDLAPKLTVKEFVLGEPVMNFEKGKVYVVEFWKNGCPPCRQIVPYLTELQKKYPQVIFIGVGVITPTNMLRGYAKKMGTKMGYRVAIDAVPEGKSCENDGAMNLNWLQASGQDGVPTAFVIDGNGKVAWISHPAFLVDDFENAQLGKLRSHLLEKICAGKWDLQAAATKFKKNNRFYSGGEKTQRWIAQLPKAEQAALRAIQKSVGRCSLWIQDNSVSQVTLNPREVTDARMKQLVKELQQLKGLRSLFLDSSEVTDLGLKELRELKGLQDLRLEHTRVSDAGLKELRSLKDLQRLCLSGTRVTDAGLKELQELERLQWLTLSGTQVTDAGLKELQRLQRLQCLFLDNTRVGDAGLKDLRGLDELQSLNLSGTRVTDAGLKDLRELKGFQVLSLDNTRVMGVGLKDLQGLQSLSGLYLNGAPVTDAGLRELKRFPGLRNLGLASTQVTDSGLQELKDLQGLQTLRLNDTQVTDVGLKELQGLIGVQELDLGGTRVTDAGMQEVKRLQKLQQLDLSRTQVTGVCVAELEKALPKMQTFIKP